MKKKRTTYSVFQSASAVFMILALAWLTISAPFVYASQQELQKQNKTTGSTSPINAEEEAASNFSNTTEEKKPSGGSSFSEEYLHDHHADDYFFTVSSQYEVCENATTYIAYHGEVQVPPPNQA